MTAEGAVPERRKAIRRAFHRLRERGVAVPAARAPGTTSASPARIAPEHEAWLSAVDGLGTRLVWLAVAQPRGDGSRAGRPVPSRV